MIKERNKSVIIDGDSGEFIPKESWKNADGGKLCPRSMGNPNGPHVCFKERCAGFANGYCRANFAFPV